LHDCLEILQYTGQVCALYCTDRIECYGGGIFIEEKGESYYEMGYSEMVDIDTKM